MNRSTVPIFSKSYRADCSLAISRQTGRKQGDQLGFSLVELMIAMSISLVLLGGVAQVYSSSKQTYRAQEANSRLQESGRTATILLQRDIRPAGFQGCRSLNAINPNVVAQPPLPEFDGSASTKDINGTTVVRGYEGTSGSWLPTLPAALGTVATDTDVIAIQRANSCGANLTADMSTVDSDIQIAFPNACNFADGQIIVVSSCSNVDIFRANGITDTGAIQTIEHNDAVTNSSTSLSTTYNIGADVMGFSSLTYYIATGADGQPSLWRYDDTSATVASVNPIELVSNVSDMQIEYGQDTNGDMSANFYVPANSIINDPDWAAVVSVRISLLVQTRSATIASQPQVYTYNRASVTAPDRRLYRVFTTTISLRNKVS